MTLINTIAAKIVSKSACMILFKIFICPLPTSGTPELAVTGRTPCDHVSSWAKQKAFSSGPRGLPKVNLPVATTLWTLDALLHKS